MDKWVSGAWSVGGRVGIADPKGAYLILYLVLVVLQFIAAQAAGPKNISWLANPRITPIQADSAYRRETLTSDHNGLNITNLHTSNAAFPFHPIMSCLYAPALPAQRLPAQRLPAQHGGVVVYDFIFEGMCREPSWALKRARPALVLTVCLTRSPENG